MSIVKANSVQHGLQAAWGTTAAATFKHFGSGVLKFDDQVNTYGFDMNVGAHSGIVELTSVDRTGAVLTLPDFPFSAEAAIWFFNQAIKALPGAASSFSFAFPVPGAAANSINYFTYELNTDTQEYEFDNGFITRFSIHAAEDNPWILMNAVVEGGNVTASTVTGGLSWLAARETLTLPAATIKIDNLGTAPGTAAATTGYLKEFNIDVETGFTRGYYAAGRTAKDYGTVDYHGYKISGKLRAAFGATAVTHIALARAGTGKNIQIACPGSSSRNVAFNMPIIYDAVPELGGTDKSGFQLVEFSFKSGDSTTSTAASPSFVVTASGSTTVT